MSETILVTSLAHQKGEQVFKTVETHKVLAVEPAEEALADKVISCQCRAVIVGTDPYRGPLYEALGQSGGSGGALIARFGVGHDNIDKALAAEHGIIVTNTPGMLDTSVAEHAFWLIGELARRLCRAQSRLRDGHFSFLSGTELAGKALGVVGFGAIARRVAAIARLGFGMRVLAADIRPLEALLQPGESAESALARLSVDRYTTELEEVFRQSDIISIHCTANEQTRHLVNAERLGWMKPGALLVNTARGSIVEEDALYDFLQAGPLGGAALDVFENEPYKPVTAGKDLRTLENVVLTPHIGSNTHEANQRMAQRALKNVELFFLGQTGPMDRVPY